MRASNNESHTATNPANGGRYPEDPAYIEWLERRSMLFQAEHLSSLVAGKSRQWQNPYGHPQPRIAVLDASVWFTSYPQATITAGDKSVLETLGSPDLLATFGEIGIKGIHTGPMRRAGGISDRVYTSTIDGLFDRIELTIDPLFGTDEQYVEMTRSAKDAGIAVIGDLIPSHTGKGADFRLAERAYKNYAGLYTMVEIREADWELLGTVPKGEDCANLSPETVQILEDKGYIPGPLELIVFHDPGIKDSNWSATDVVVGADGERRRWVYLHIFKAGQPSLNWLDPTMGAQRIVAADIVHALHELGATGVRLDASPLLAVEGRHGIDKSWVEGHPLAEAGANLIAMLIRKLGGFSFQELNQPLEELRDFTTCGADLSYDFFTRPPYLYAMAVGDAGPIRLMLRLIQDMGLNHGMLVHALQNHDELMFDLTHMSRHGDQTFVVNGETTTGLELCDRMYQRAKDVVIGDRGSLSDIHEFSNLGFCATLASYAAASLAIRDPYRMTQDEVARVRALHLTAAVFNAMQPGVFALSGWDLTGALLVGQKDLGSLLDDRDYRWMNRGAFDLMNVNPGAARSAGGLPRAKAIYGSLPEQLQNPDSFVSHLQRILRVRKEYGIAVSTLASVPETQSQGAVVMLLELPDESGWVLAAVNFARESARERIRLPELAGRSARLAYSTTGADGVRMDVSEQGEVSVLLGPIQADVFVVE